MLITIVLVLVIIFDSHFIVVQVYYKLYTTVFHILLPLQIIPTMQDMESTSVSSQEISLPTSPDMTTEHEVSMN